MNTEKLIKTLPIIQNQLDALLDFQVREGVHVHVRPPAPQSSAWFQFQSKCKFEKKQQFARSDSFLWCSYVRACVWKGGVVGWGLSEIARLIVVCAGKLQRLIKRLLKLLIGMCPCVFVS